MSNHSSNIEIHVHRAAPTAHQMGDGVWINEGDITLFLVTPQHAITLGEDLVRLGTKAQRIRDIESPPTPIALAEDEAPLEGRAS